MIRIVLHTVYIICLCKQHAKPCWSCNIFNDFGSPSLIDRYNIWITLKQLSQCNVVTWLKFVEIFFEKVERFSCRLYIRKIAVNMFSFVQVLCSFFSFFKLFIVILLYRFEIENSITLKVWKRFKSIFGSYKLEGIL